MLCTNFPDYVVFVSWFHECIPFLCIVDIKYELIKQKGAMAHTQTTDAEISLCIFIVWAGPLPSDRRVYSIQASSMWSVKTLFRLSGSADWLGSNFLMHVYTKAFFEWNSSYMYVCMFASMAKCQKTNLFQKEWTQASMLISIVRWLALFTSVGNWNKQFCKGRQFNCFPL